MRERLAVLGPALRVDALWWAAGLGFAVGLLQGRYAPSLALWTVFAYVGIGAWRTRPWR